MQSEENFCSGSFSAGGGEALSQQQNRTDLSEFIAENFGANATYVEGLLSRFRNDPALVDESWRAYFTELLGGTQTQENGRATAQMSGDGAGASGAAATATAPQPATTQPASAREATPSVPTPAKTVENATPIRGGALKIVENMETSLSVPTATSNRRVPVKVLDENRAIVNQFLKEHKRGKTSYTHFIAFAILRALERFPQMNDGFSVVEGQPARLRRAEVNLGLAIDLENRDGTRTLLVPTIKNAGA